MIVPFTDLVLTVESGKRPKGGVGLIESGILSLGGEHLTENGTISLTKPRFIPVEFYESLRKGKVLPNDILIVKDGATTGRVARIPEHFPSEAAVNEHIFIVRTNQKRILQEFAFYYLRSADGQAAIMSDFRGAAQGGIGRSFVERISIPLPPLDEQRRIVGILNRATRIERLRQQAARRLREFIPALFVKMFGDQDQIGVKFQCLPLRETAAIVSGATKGRKINPADAIEVPYLRVANVQDGFLDLSEIKTITIRRGEERKFALAPGDLVMTEGGDPDKLGRAAVWNGELAYCAHQNHVFRVRPHSEVVLTDYLREIVGSAYGKAYFISVAKRTTGIASINKSQLGDFPVPVPPVSQQALYAETIQRFRETALAGSFAATSSAALTASLMNRLLDDLEYPIPGSGGRPS